MRIEVEDTDYRIFLNDDEIRQLTDRTPTGIDLDIFPRYLPINETFKDNRGAIKELEITCTRDAVILNDINTHDDIYFNSDEFGPYVKVYTPKLASLLFGRDYLVTRYDAESKIWIHKENN
ncbi:MAG: hypothetical protein GQ477_03980 [Nanohaloarchaea archaeon]|nr:hypothetical protein [Candidatus Nanohaloarchaea archaeon]